MSCLLCLMTWMLHGGASLKTLCTQGSRLMSEDQIHGWAESIKKAKAERDAARASEQQVVLLKATLTDQDTEIAHLRIASMGSMPYRITGINGIRGSHLYFLDLTMEEAGLVVAARSINSN